MKHGFYYDTSVGRIGIVETGGPKGAVCNVFWSKIRLPQITFTERETALLRKAGNQLKEYVKGERQMFDFPMVFIGTEFEQKVWKALLSIPYGETRSYGEIARQIGNAKAYRAVGRANANNPLCIFVPCHRVLSAGGKLTGYEGGLDRKRRLLRLEGIDILE